MTLTKKQKRYIFQFLFNGLWFAAFMSADMYFIEENFSLTRALIAFFGFGSSMTAFQYWLEWRKERKAARNENPTSI